MTVVEGKAGSGNPFESANLHGFRAGDYANATSFARDASASSPELTVAADSGVVSTNGEITVGGVYTLVAHAASPDFVGRSRLELRLSLGAENAFRSADTIPLTDRNQEIAAVSGHAGSVAFFAAGKDGVTLRTPSSAPPGFHLGSGGLDAEFVAPSGFTLFLNAGGIADDAESASATLTLSAQAAGFADSEIVLTVSVLAVSAPAQPTASADYLQDFNVDLKFPAGYETGTAGRETEILYPLPRTGGIVADAGVCADLGGTRPANASEICVGYSESSNYAADETFSGSADLLTRGACTWTENTPLRSPVLQRLYSSCNAAFDERAGLQCGEQAGEEQQRMRLRMRCGRVCAGREVPGAEVER